MYYEHRRCRYSISTPVTLLISDEIIGTSSCTLETSEELTDDSWEPKTVQENPEVVTYDYVQSSSTARVTSEESPTKCKDPVHAGNQNGLDQTSHSLNEYCYYNKLIDR